MTPSNNLPDLKQTCESILSRFRDEEQDITRVLQNYKYILKKYKSSTHYNDECRQYIKSHLLKESYITLLKRQHTHSDNDWNLADSISECCKLLVQIINRYNKSLFGSIKPIFYHIWS